MDTANTEIPKNDRLKNRKVFSERQLIIGIPSRLFMGCLALSLATLVVISAFVGFVMGTLVLVTLYVIHKDDPDAFDFYISSLTRPSFYGVGDIEPLKVKLIKENFDDSISIIEYLPKPRSSK